jgi:L-lactate dehydrogenase complex protein LldG
MTARETILASIRSALSVPPSDPAVSYARLTQPYHRIGTLSRADRLHLFIDRLLDYDTEILEVPSEADLPSAIAAALHNADESSALIAADFPASWLPTDILFRRDHNLTVAEIEAAPAVITPCEAAVASTGTLLLVHAAAQGRRILTLLPDHHICLVHRNQVFELLPEALTAVASKSTLPLTTISGPSATSDIEMTRIRGVHGPRRLTVILYG